MQITKNVGEIAMKKSGKQLRNFKKRKRYIDRERERKETKR